MAATMENKDQVMPTATTRKSSPLVARTPLEVEAKHPLPLVPIMNLSISEPKHSPPEMPNELRERTFKLLDLEDIKTIQLTWKNWTDVAARFLFKPFIFRVECCDLERVEKVLQYSTLSDGINSLQFETGTMGLYHIEHRLGFQYLQK